MIEAYERFEAAWERCRAGQELAPSIRNFLPVDPAWLREALLELVALDLEYRWKLGARIDTQIHAYNDSDGKLPLALPSKPRLENYCRNFSELGPAANLPLDLIGWEYYVRCRFGDRPDVAEFRDRFPAQSTALEEHLAHVERQVADEVDAETRDSPSTLPVHDGPAAASDVVVEADEPVPEYLGRYQVVAKLGKGNFGNVYRCYDPVARREVAIKVPLAKRLSDPVVAEIYLAEARTVAALTNPGIVRVYDVGRTEEGVYYVVSELIPGGSLERKRQEGALSPAQAAEIVGQVAEALHYAHRRSLVHRDIKPANILLDDSGRAMLCDFGLALRAEDFGRGSHSCGSLAYMSPEQAAERAHKVDPRSDIYSLGVVLYELLTRELPYRAQDSNALRKEIADRDVEVRPPRHVNEAVPEELERICLKALAKRPADRYSTAADLARDLRRFVAEQGDRSKLRWPWKVAGLVTVVLLSVVALWVALKPGPPLRVLAIDVTHSANLGDQFDQARGVLGKESFVARLEDSVRVEALLSHPAYAYLIAFRPDGQAELCFPESENEPPPLTDRPRYPSKSRDMTYGLVDGTGLWVFAVVASDEPLPSYQEWRARQSPLPWKREETPRNVVLWDDGEWLKTLTPLGTSQLDRAKGVAAKGQKPVVQITDWLKQAAGADAAAAIGFAVVPKE